MALSTTGINAVSHDEFDDEIRLIVYDSHPLLNELNRRDGVVPAGLSFKFPIRYQKLGRADAISTDTQLNYTRKITRTQGTINWKTYSVDQLMTFDEQIKNGDGPNQIVDLLADKAKEMADDYSDRLATDLMTTNPNGLGFDSLDDIVSGTATYAGIAVADASAWQAGIEDASTTKLELSGAGSLGISMSASTFGPDKPNFHVTTRDLKDKFESLLEPQKRYTASVDLASAGFDNVAYKGDPVVGDSYTTDGYWYGLDLGSLKLCYHKDFNMKIEDWFGLEQAGHPNQLARVSTSVLFMMCDSRQTNFKYSTLDDAL
jgi:hypothetical protein